MSGGVVLSCGYGKFGQCGVGDTKTQQNIVKLNIGAIRLLECGDGHCIAVDNQNRVYAWGSNRFGQCGVLPFGNFVTPTLIEPLSTPDKKVATIACGTSHCAVALASGEVYTFGCGTEGRLGLGDEGPRYAPTKVDSLSNIKIVGLGAGMLFTIALSDKGKVYSWGCNRYGQLGNPAVKGTLVPQKVVSLDSMFIEKVTCGRSHTLVITEKGSIFGFGHNMCGQLGDKSTDDARLPKMAALPQGVRAARISCGYYHSICLSVEGTVYSWGYNAEGALGLGAVMGHQLAPHSLNHSLHPILQADEKVVEVKAGGWHSAIVTSMPFFPPPVSLIFFFI
eukprot:Phypoly_transcript_07424.p1 GENE.Phypoly_transcript_07424~~Phypoly_transcript_07424.p1  ORF type:complete len:336 (+),score=27.28 Phypoly_transcript_07424:109-1116(+)